MTSCNAADWVSAIATCFGAAAAIAAAAIALWAASTWREGLKNQRYDECLAAALHFEAVAYACRSAIETRNRLDLAGKNWVEESVWKTYSAAWERQSQFVAAVSIARRYDPSKFPAELTKEVDAILTYLRDQAKSNTPDDRRLAKLLSDLSEIVGKIKVAVGEARHA